MALVQLRTVFVVQFRRRASRGMRGIAPSNANCRSRSGVAKVTCNPGTLRGLSADAAQAGCFQHPAQRIDRRSECVLGGGGEPDD
jgi:hypothetical protein